MSGVLNLVATTELTRPSAHIALWRWHRGLYHANEPITLLKLSAVRLLRSDPPWAGWFGIRIPVCLKFPAHVQAPGLFPAGKGPRGGADQPRLKIGTAVPLSCSFCAGYRLPCTRDWSNRYATGIVHSQLLATDRGMCVCGDTQSEKRRHKVCYTHTHTCQPRTVLLHRYWWQLATVRRQWQIVT